MKAVENESGSRDGEHLIQVFRLKEARARRPFAPGRLYVEQESLDTVDQFKSNMLECVDRTEVPAVDARGQMADAGLAALIQYRCEQAHLFRTGFGVRPTGLER